MKPRQRAGSFAAHACALRAPDPKVSPLAGYGNNNNNNNFAGKSWASGQDRPIVPARVAIHITGFTSSCLLAEPAMDSQLQGWHCFAGNRTWSCMESGIFVGVSL